MEFKDSETLETYNNNMLNYTTNVRVTFLSSFSYLIMLAITFAYFSSENYVKRKI